MSATRLPASPPPVAPPSGVRQPAAAAGQTRLFYSPFGTMPDFTRCRQPWAITTPPDIRLHTGRPGQRPLATLRDGVPFVVCRMAATGQHVADDKGNQLTPAQVARHIRDDGLSTACPVLNFGSVGGNGAAFFAAQLLHALRGEGYSALSVMLFDGSGAAQAVSAPRTPTGHGGASGFDTGRAVPASCRGLNLGGG